MKKRIAIIISAFIVAALGAGPGSVQAGPAQREKELSVYEQELTTPREPIDSPRLTSLDGYVNLALTRNPQLRSAFYEWKAAFKKIASESSLPDPYFSYATETRNRPREQSYSVSQMVPLPDKMWVRRERAFHNSEIVHQNFIKTRLEVINQVSEAYYEYAYLRTQTLATEESLSLLSTLERVTQSRYAVGLAGHQDILNVRAELAALENELVVYQDFRQPLMARLNSLLNLPHETRLPWPQDSFEELPPIEQYEQVAGLMGDLEESNPQLAAAAQKVERDEASLKLARREFFPDLMVEVTKGNAMGMMSSDTEPLTVMASVNIPLWFGRIRADISGAEATLSAAREGKDDRKNELQWELAAAHYKLRDARRQSRLYTDVLIPQAAQALNAAHAAYEAGKVDFISLIDAQRGLLDLKKAYYRHNANYYQQRARIRFLIGEDDVW